MKKQIMDPTLKSKWIAALRSGQFKQGMRTLHDTENEAFCCLGVLGCVTGMTIEQMEGWALLPTSRAAPIFGSDEGTVQLKLSHMNDGDNGDNRLSFEEIADWIEKYL